MRIARQIRALLIPADRAPEVVVDEHDWNVRSVAITLGGSVINGHRLAMRGVNGDDLTVFYPGVGTLTGAAPLSTRRPALVVASRNQVTKDLEPEDCYLLCAQLVAERTATAIPAWPSLPKGQ